MTLVYATSTDLATWTGTTAPANATQLLRSASLLITEQTVAAYYDADTTGLPTNTAILQAFKDATCAQVAVWVAASIDPLTDGLSSTLPVRSKAIGTGKIDYDTSLAASPAAVAARQALATGLCTESQRILREVGILSTRTWTYG